MPKRKRTTEGVQNASDQDVQVKRPILITVPPPEDFPLLEDDMIVLPLDDDIEISTTIKQEEEITDKSPSLENILEYFEDAPAASSTAKTNQPTGTNSRSQNRTFSHQPPQLPAPGASSTTITNQPTGTSSRPQNRTLSHQPPQLPAPGEPSNEISQAVSDSAGDKPQRDCCVIEKLVKRFQSDKVPPLPEQAILMHYKFGRPMPDIPSLGVTNKVYEHHWWVTGCQSKEKVYCWMCLLFTKGTIRKEDHEWVRDGFKTKHYLRTATYKHTMSPTHQEALTYKDVIVRKKLAKNSWLARAYNNGSSEPPDDLPDNSKAKPRGPTKNKASESVSVKQLTQGQPDTAADQSKVSKEPATKQDAKTKKKGKELPTREVIAATTKNQQIKYVPLTNTAPATIEKPKNQLSRIEIGALQMKCFPKGTFNGSEKLREEIIATGRPTPMMPGLSQTGPDGDSVHFDPAYYEEYPWLCGSAELNRLYCWCCLIYNNPLHHNTWNTVGFNHLIGLATAAKAHSINQSHMELALRLKIAEETIKQKLGTKPNPPKHNQMVRQKRLLLKYLIDAICFKKKQLNNAEICHEHYTGFLTLLSTWDIQLKTLINPKSKDYMEDFTPNFVQNYSRSAAKALKLILKQKISQEVETAVFVSFILKNVKNNSTALILRYCKSSGEILERFYKFIKIGFDSQDFLLKQILTEVKELKCSSKFVGISYDGGLLNPGRMDSFNSSLRRELPAGFFFHNRDENFKTLLQQSLFQTPFCRNFLSNVQEIAKFLEDNPRVLHSIKKMEDEIQKGKKWELKTDVIITICDHYSAIMQFLDQVVNKPSVPLSWTNKVLYQCGKFFEFLEQRATRFMLVLLSTMYIGFKPLIEAFDGEFDAKRWQKSADDACAVVLDVRTYQFEKMCIRAERMRGKDGLVLGADERQKLMMTFNRALDWMWGFIKYRAKYIDVWTYFDLSFNKSDSPFARAFSHQTQFLKELKLYFPLFDNEKLGSALMFSRTQDRFRNKSVEEMIQLMIDWDLKTVLPDLFNYLLLVQTVPLASAPAGAPVSAKIASYSEGKTNLNSADALFYIENDLLAAAKNEDTFYNDVIKIIAVQKRTEEFTEI